MAAAFPRRVRADSEETHTGASAAVTQTAKVFVSFRSERFSWNTSGAILGGISRTNSHSSSAPSNCNRYHNIPSRWYTVSIVPIVDRDADRG